MFTLPSHNVLDSLSDVSSSDEEEEKNNHNVSSSDGEMVMPSQRFAPVRLTEVLRKRNKIAKIRYDSSKILPKYWKRRYDLFERFDEGVQLDEESWYSVTPECIARRQAKACACDFLVDAFAGVGGNTIHFAQNCGLVLAIENCFPRLLMLQNNAGIYGVLPKIMLVCGDVETILNSLRCTQSPINPSTNTNGNNHDTMGTENSDEKCIVRTSFEMTSNPSENSTSNPQENGESSVNPPETSIPVEGDASFASDINTAETPHVLQQLDNEASSSKSDSELNQNIESITSKEGEEKSAPSIIDVIFMSPPWGGPGYTGKVFPPGSTSWNRKKRKNWLADFDEIEPTKNLGDILLLNKALSAARHACSRILLYLPRNSSIGQLIQLSWPLHQEEEGLCNGRLGNCSSCKQYLNVHIESYCLRGRQLALGLYLGDFPFLEKDIIVYNKDT
uniref:Trimethylguanosine synthase n=1 Tax=Trichobilharzia regenti TaxID=157069 RepID=A0AA85J6W6_TRIRE|nr:unnamed protein product [Trichobilharzia regenti]